MRIVFWQNCISPHQMPYIIKLLNDSRVQEVVVVSDEVTSKERINMGWQQDITKEAETLKIFIHPEIDIVEKLLHKDQEKSWHMFSGINSFPYISQIFKLSLNYHIKRGLITERPYTFAFGRANGKPLWVHRLRFLIQDFKYAKYIDKVFVMGNDGVDYFKSVFKRWEVIPFCYCTNTKTTNISNIRGTSKFCFIGSLSCRKSPITIVKAAAQLNKEFEITYIGGGEQQKKIENYINQHKLNNVTILGFQKMEEIPSILSNQDILILPSIYDGWGAVVNEALQSGLYVISSNQCGAKDLLKDPRCGKIFESGNFKQLSQIMKDCVEHINEIRLNRSYRANWAENHISGDVIAKYMIEHLEK